MTLPSSIRQRVDSAVGKQAADYLLNASAAADAILAADNTWTNTQTFVGGVGTPPKTFTWDFSTATGDDNQPVIKFLDAVTSGPLGTNPGEPRMYFTATGGLFMDDSIIIGGSTPKEGTGSDYRITPPLGDNFHYYNGPALGVQQDVSYPAIEVKGLNPSNVPYAHLLVGWDYLDTLKILVQQNGTINFANQSLITAVDGTYVFPDTVTNTIDSVVNEAVNLYHSDGGVLKTDRDLSVAGTLALKNIPTSDPHIAGALWSNSGAVTVSAGGAANAIAFVTNTANGYNSATNVSTAFDIAQGNFVVAAMIYVLGGTAVSPSRVDDTGGNVYTKAATVTNGAGEPVELWYCPNARAKTGAVVTFHFPTGSTFAFTAVATATFTGVGRNVNCLDVTSTKTGTGTSLTSDAFVTTTANQLIVALCYSQFSIVPVAGATYTMKTDATNGYIGIEYKMTTAAGSNTASFTTGSSSAMAIVVATFKAMAY